MKNLFRWGGWGELQFARTSGWGWGGWGELQFARTSGWGWGGWGELQFARTSGWGGWGELSEAPLPYKVDIVDMATVTTAFKTIIDTDKILFPFTEENSKLQSSQ